MKKQITKGCNGAGEASGSARVALPRPPAEPSRYLARNQRIVLMQSRNMMTIEWSPEIKEMLNDARHLSERLGHFEIVTLTHVYGVLLSRLQGRNGNDVATTLTTIDPPWPADSVYLSPGGRSMFTHR